jgi:methyl-accepting chemotaxis protein
MLSLQSVRARLSATIGALLLLVIVLAATAMLSLRAVDDAANEVSDRWLPSTAAVTGMLADLNRYRQVQALYLLEDNAAERQRVRREIEAARGHVNEQWAQYTPLIATQEERLLADAVQHGLQAYLAQHDNLLEVAGRDRAAAAALFASELDEAYRPIRQAVKDLVAKTREGADEASARSDAAQSQGTVLLSIFTILALVIGVAAWFWMDRGTARPLGALSLRMRALGEGDNTSAVPAVERKDEVGQMAQAVEGFRQSAIERERIAAEQAAEQAAKLARTERVDALVRRFEAEATEALRAVASASTELDATARAMQETAQDGNSQATTLAAAAEQASANVQTVAASTEEMSSSIAEVARQIAETARVARQTADEARATDGAVASLAESANRIGEVVRLIGDIASQTNLLALNATIEAARAGEAGKGFAVVASEVKQLASQTAKATEEIGQQIGAMQAETTRAVDAIRGIARTIESMDGLTSQVASAAEEQAAAVQEIGRAVAQAAAGTTEVSRTASGVTEGAQRTGAAATQLRAASGELSQQAEGLRGQVDGFLSGIRAA